MREHSETAWAIASQYSSVLASETRDLAAQIDRVLRAEYVRGYEAACKWADEEVKRAAAGIKPG